MSEENIQVKVQILDRDYQLVCKEEERNDLIAAARYLDDKMREMRARGGVAGTDRLAVVAALNIAHELLTLRGEQSTLSSLSSRVAEISIIVQKALKE